MSPTNPQIKLPDELALIPANSGGIYAIFCEFPDDRELGIRPDQDDWDLVTRNMLKALERRRRLFEDRSLTGTLVHRADDAKHLRREFKLDARTAHPVIAPAVVSRLAASTTEKYAAFCYLTRLCRNTYTLCRPIYVGVASEQSLRTRLEQHLQADSPLSTRLQEYQIPWSQTACNYLELPAANKHMARDLERIIQYICTPPLSLR